jgi:hypothetical protein
MPTFLPEGFLGAVSYNRFPKKKTKTRESVITHSLQKHTVSSSTIHKEAVGKIISRRI